jgi:preprotein translocase subunit SecD
VIQPGQTLWAAALLVSLIGNLWLVLSRADAQRSHAQAQATLATERADRERERAQAALALTAAVEQARQTEAQWRARHTEVQSHAENQIRVASADAARARSAADILRQRADVLGAQCAAERPDPGTDPATASAGQTTTGPGAVLADLLGRLAQTAAELAAVADARGGAGETCVQAYGALLQAPEQSKTPKPSEN